MEPAVSVAEGVGRSWMWGRVLGLLGLWGGGGGGRVLGVEVVVGFMVL